MAGKKKKKKPQDKKAKCPDGFLAYQFYKAENQIGAEYRGGAFNIRKEGESFGE